MARKFLDTKIEVLLLTENFFSLSIPSAQRSGMPEADFP